MSLSLRFARPIPYVFLNYSFQVASYLLGCDWVVQSSSGQEVDLAEAAQQALVAAAAQDHTEVINLMV